MKNMSERGELLYSESGGMDSSDSSRISSNDRETKSWESNRIYEPETNTKGNANITVLFSEIT